MRRGGDSALLLLLDGSLDKADMGLQPRVDLEDGMAMAYGNFLARGELKRGGFGATA